MNKILLFLLILVAGRLQAQKKNPDTEAYRLAKQAVGLMDNGAYEQAIDLLEQSYELDPHNYVYPYEIGYAYMLKKRYDKAIQIFERVVEMDSISDQCYQMLGNAYSMDGQKKMALEAYNRGLIHFPQSGRLYLEIGNEHKDDMEALEYYEKGIEAEPAFASNYYWACRIYCNSDCELWGLIYGEMFMNIERGSKRTAEISKLLYDTYISEIQIENDSIVSISFCNNLVVNPNEELLPFTVVFEQAMLPAVYPAQKVNMALLSTLRLNFIQNKYRTKTFERYPLDLFDWQCELFDQGWFKCYNYWLLMRGDQDEFGRWYQQNQEKFDAFLEWFETHPMPMNDSHSLHKLH